MITEINFTEKHTAPLGLQPAKLHELKSLVVLAGPNGAGKSRYLNLVKKIATAMEPVKRELSTQTKNLEFLRQNDTWRFQDTLPKAQQRITELQTILQDLKHSEEYPPQIIPLNYSLGFDHTVDDDSYGSNPLDASPSDVDDTVASNTTGGFQQALSSVYAYFFDVARALHDAEHPYSQKLEQTIKAREDAIAFNAVLRALLNMEIEPALTASRRVVAMIRGRLFDPSELSKGELILVVWAIILHRQREWLHGSCILIDEPENHLHPDVCIKALSALQNQIIGPNGQIWMATHSIPLIAHAGMSSIYFVDNGTLTYASNKIEKVIDRLMGGQEGRTKLRSFLSDAEQIAFDVFAAQCLLPPEVAKYKEKDPQQAQMLAATSTFGTNKKSIRILDFSAGRGRFAVELKQASLASPRSFIYYAFNDASFTKQSEAEECLEHIRQLEQSESAEQYLVDSLYKLTGPGLKPMDVVVMCNVLHEVPVEHWRQCFKEIFSVLAEDGHLVILEDQFPNVGELPHKGGYVILDELALQELFCSQDAVTPLHSQTDARLTAFAITRAALSMVSPKSIGKALGKVSKRARWEIGQIRSVELSKRTYQLGRRHAHFTLLYANAQLAMEIYPDE